MTTKKTTAKTAPKTQSRKRKPSEELPAVKNKVAKAKGVKAKTRRAVAVAVEDHYPGKIPEEITKAVDRWLWKQWAIQSAKLLASKERKEVSQARARMRGPQHRLAVAVDEVFNALRDIDKTFRQDGIMDDNPPEPIRDWEGAPRAKGKPDESFDASILRLGRIFGFVVREGELWLGALDRIQKSAPPWLRWVQSECDVPIHLLDVPWPKRTKWDPGFARIVRAAQHEHDRGGTEATPARLAHVVVDRAKAKLVTDTKGTDREIAERLDHEVCRLLGYKRSIDPLPTLRVRFAVYLRRLVPAQE
jgi:hypothetical protein